MAQHIDDLHKSSVSSTIEINMYWLQGVVLLWLSWWLWPSSADEGLAYFLVGLFGLAGIASIIGAVVKMTKAKRREILIGKIDGTESRPSSFVDGAKLNPMKRPEWKH